MAEQLIELGLITDNPYQPRTTDDAEHIEKLARSIATDGLLQAPKARQNGSIQIAFGHSRRKAFEWLAANWSAQGLPDRYEGYSCMPLDIVELTDEEMYRHAVSENVQRKDLNAIELAKAMVTYRDQFNKNSEEIGALFGMSGATVRGLVRLLELPRDIQEGVATGEITQGNARRLLTLNRVAPEQLKHIAKELKKDVDPDIVIFTALIDSGNTVEMWQRWRSGEPKAGEHLWLLRLPAEKFPKNHLPQITVTEAAKIVGGDWSSHHDKGVLQNYINWFQNGGWPAGLLEQVNRDGKYDRLAHLINPPACTACPFYAKVNGSHFCTYKPCFNRKAQAWTKHEFERAIKKLGIAQYDHKVDGKFEVMVTYNPTHTKLVNEKHADLRLKKGNQYHGFEGVPAGFVIVAVGKTAEKLQEKEKAKDNQEDMAAYYAEQRRLQAIRATHREAVFDFLWNVATPAFQSLLSDLKGLEFIKSMSDQFVNGVPAEEPNGKSTKAEKIDFYRRALIFQLLSDTLDRQNELWRISEKKTPNKALVKPIEKIATSWGVKLPKNFVDLAIEADKAIKHDVSTETEPA